MPSVRFLPADIAVDVPEGTLLHEAAIKAGLADLHLPCGGKGTCGQCLVEVVGGHANGGAGSHLDRALAAKGMVLACQTKVRQDATIRLRPRHESAMRVLGDSHLLVSEDLMPAPAELSPLWRGLHLTVPMATVEEHYSDWQRLIREIARVCGPGPVGTSWKLLSTLAHDLRAEKGRVTLSLREQEGAWSVEALHPGSRAIRGYGLAVDVGTTTVVVQLVDLVDGRVLASRSSYNGQIARGADIITRIDYARTEKRLAELRGLVLETLNALILEVCEDAPVPDSRDPERAIHAVLSGSASHPLMRRIEAVSVAGNTTMIHLLLGLPPQHIRRKPYVPTVNPVPRLTAKEVGLKVRGDSLVAFAPGVGSYVGGDITAGVLCTDLPRRSDEVFLFMDIGTNGEIVLGNADWMVTCACSAGPAFEGSGIQCGMRAMEGAVEYVEIGDGGHEVRCDVIGGGKPAGICGSGLISLLGELFLRGIIDPMGHFHTELPTDRLVQRGAVPAFVVEWGANTRDGQDLAITEADIENLMRTKAAIYAACALILENVGFEWSGISRVYIAGGFGRYIQVEDAILIGLLPDLPRERFIYIGNSALTGAYLCLLSRERREELAAVAERMTYVDLSSDPHYMDQYVGALFLPHTDMERFPTVKERLERAARGC